MQLSFDAFETSSSAKTNVETRQGEEASNVNDINSLLASFSICLTFRVCFFRLTALRIVAV